MKKILALLVATVSFSCSNAQKTAFSKEALSEKLVALDGSEVAFKTILERLYKNKEINYQISDTTSVFFRGATNEYGDLISHYNNPSKKPIPRAILSDKVSLKGAINDMNAFYEAMKSKEVKVYFIYPTYSEENYILDKKIIYKYQQEYEKYAHFPILGKPTDFVFADSLYQDMAYHLTQKGGEIRTQKIIQLLGRISF